MAKKLGTIKSISGSAEVIAVDKSGNQRVLKVGDSLYEGETVKTTSADSKVVIATNNGKELSMIGEDTLSLDPRATTGDSQVAALQKALLNGANLGDLEETAAGGTSGGRAGDGVSLGETRFEHGGHYSNVSTSTSAINSLGGFGFASPETGVRGGLDNDGTGGGTGFYIDTTAPVVTINSINPVDTNEKADGNPDKGIVTGKSDEPNAPVVVKDKDGKIIGSGTTDDKGNFEVPTDAIKTGDKVTVEVTDKAGNTGKGDGTAGNTVYTDTTPPTVEDVKVTPVDENNPADGNPDKGIVKGHSDEPNAPVVVKDKDGKIIGSGTTDDKGNFEVPTDAIKTGDKVTVEVTDKAGNTGKGDGTAGNTVYTDTTPPTEPTITFVEDINPKDGKLNKAENGSDSDNANTTAKISIPTDAVVNDVIKYTVNGEEKSHPITDADKAKGHIEVKVPVVDGKTSTVTAKIVDQAGNASKEVSGSVDVDLTIGNPKVRFLEDTDNNGVLSVAEVAAIKDGKAHWVIDIPTDGSIKAGDVIQSIDSKGNWVKFVTITDEMIKDGRFEATFNVDIEKLRNGKYETPEYRFADDAGNISDSSKATLTLDSELTRQPSNPSIKFPEDTNEDGKISDKENKEGDKDAGKTTAEVVIPKDGSVKPGDKLIVTDDNGKETVRPIEQSDIDKGSIDVPVDLNPGKDNNVTAEIINPNNPNNPGKDSKVIGEDSENTKAPEAPVINEIIDDVKGYGEDTKVGNVLDVKGHLTNDKTPTIKGTAKAGSKVEIYDNGDRIGETTAKADGSWEFAAPELTKQGEHKFTATAENKFGKSTPSNEATIDLDSIAPKLDNVKITPIDTNSKADDTAELTMGTGHTDTPNAEILFRDVDNNIIGKGHANSAGDFLIQLDKAVQPGTPVFVQAIDKAGNAGTEMATAGNIEHPNDHTAPSEPTITFVEDINPKDGKLNKAENGSDSDNANTTAKISIPTDAVVNDVIKYTVNGEEKSHPITDADKAKGHIEVKVPVVDGKTSTVTAKIVDQAGNASKEVSGSVDVDLTIGNPKVRFLEDTDNNGVLSVAEVAAIKDGKAHWVIDIPTDGSIKAGDVIQSIDSKGNWVKFVTITDEMIKDGRFEATFNVDIEKLRNGKYETPEYRFADDAGNISDSSKATLTLDSELTRQPSNPSIKFPEDTNEDGKISDKENKEGDKDAGKTTAEVVIPKDGSVKPGDKLIVKDNSDKPKEHVITEKDIENGKVEVAVDIKTGDKTTITAEIVNPNNPSKPSEEISKDITEASSTVQVTIDEIYDDVAGGVVNGDVKNGLTNDNLPTFKGSAAPGATVEIYESFLTTTEKTLVGKTVADANGKWSFTPTEAMGDGLHYFEAHATDSAGNKSITPKVELDVDATAPSVENLKVSPLDISNPADNTPEKGRVEGSSDTQDAKVIVKDEAGNVIGEGKVGGDGKFVIDTTKPLNPGDKIKVEITDEAGNTGKGSAVTGNDIIHTHATTQVTIDEIYDDVAGGVVNGDVKNGLTNDNLPTFKGSAAPGATVEIYESFLTTTEKTLVGKTVADANGKWSFTPTEAMGDGLHYFEAHATDSAGNKSITPKVELDVDATANAPVINAVNDDVDSHTGNVLDAKTKVALTNDSTPTLEGYAEPNSVVTIYEISELSGDKRAIGTTTADKHGGWKFELPQLEDGEYQYTTRAQDKAGNISDFSETVVVNVDLVAPSEPTIIFVEDINKKDGKLNKAENGKDGDNASTTAQISVPGDAEENDVIHYTVNGEEKTHTITYNDRVAGYIEVKVPVVDGQTSTITAKIVDQAGNASEMVKESISSDFTAPNTPVITAVIDEWYGGVEFDNVLGKDKGLTNDNTPKFKGTAEAGSTIVLKNGNEIIGEDIEVKTNGTWEFTPKTPLADGEYNVTATATDKAGNVSNPSNVATINVDTNCAKPVITEIIDDVAGGAVNGDVKFGLTNDNLPTLKGTAEAFAEVKFMIDGRPVFKDGKQVSVTADENGKWEYTLEVNSNWGGKVHAALEDGRHTFEAQATDKAGNNSKPSDVVSVDVDTTARAPKVMITADADDNNILTATEASALTDGKLKWVIKLPEDAKEGDRIEVSNSHREWVTVLTLSAANVAKGEVVRDDFSADFVKGRPGFQTPSYRIVDQAGNISAEGTDSVRFDKTAPTAPVIKEVIDDHKGYDDDTRVGDVLKVEGGLTNDNTPTIKGTAEAGIKVDIYDNGKFIGTTKADTNGNWEFTPSTSAVLPDGKHSITAVAKNALDVESAPSNAANIDVDTVTPKPTIDSITDNVEGGIYKGDVKGGLTNDNRPVFEGKAEKGAFIELFDNDKVIGATKAGEDGKWTIQPKEPMADGKHNMVVQATDLAGNRSRSDQTSSDVDTTSPGVVKITAVCDDVAGYNGKVGNILGVNNGLTDDSTPTIKGTAKPGVTITIKDGDKVVDGDIKYNGDGSWEFTPKTPLAEGKHELTAIATSKTGVVSNPSNVAAIDVDTKIADAKVEFIEDTNNDGKFSWKENIENTHTGRLSWKALIPDDGSIKAGDIFHYKWDETGWHERAISQAEIDRGYIGEMKNNQIDKDQPDAGKPMPYGKNANGSVYVAEAYFSDAAGNKGAKGSDKVVFDFSDNQQVATTNVKITSIYDDVRGGHVGNLITNEAAQVAGLTNDKTPTISGTAEANASVKVSVVDGKSHSVWEKTITAESDGSWKVTTDDIADGNYSVTAVATNKAGVVSNPYVVSNLEIDTTIAQPNIWIKEDANQDKIYDKADYENPANGNGDITFVVDIPQDRVTIKAGDVFHYMINTNNPKWGNINGYTEDITITEADIKSGSISRVVTLCDDGKDFNMSHDGMIVSMNGYFKDLAGNALSNDTMVRFDLKNTYGGKVRSTRSLPDDILDNDSVDLSKAAHLDEPKAELNVLNNNKIGVSANDLLETPKDHIMSEGKSEAKPSYATASSHAGEENIATTHPIQIEEKVENHF
ncbi:Ig-like domain-containing protein [Campylobacter concisus]|uniref:Ig-like domain-containing protein n=1 Tax=Campylobacter concisus TaxID=199 RepID=UPI00131AE5F9|nr:Ig-like domain-containing protein [Campylobacter concisus]